MPIRLRPTSSARVIDFARTIGLATMLLTIGVETRAFTRTPLNWWKWGPILLIGFVLAGVARELSIALGMAILNGRGLDFYREGRTLSGRRFQEVWRPHGVVEYREWHDR